MQRLTVACAVFLGLLAGRPAAAQDWRPPDPKAEPWRDAKMRLGPVFFSPTFQLRDLGIDDNVFNDPDNPRRDLTGSLVMESLAGLQIRALLVTVRQTNSYVWYRQYRSERSVDGGLKAVAELRFDRLRPWVNIEGIETHARGGYEIDARAGRRTPSYDYGTDIRFGWRLGASVAYRSQKVRYAEGEEFDGVDLRESLDHKAEEFRAYASYELTPFTSFVAGGEYRRERFDFTSTRDSDSSYYYGGFESSSDAPLGHNLIVGWKRQRHTDPTVPDFEGIVAKGKMGFVVGDFMRLDFSGRRDVGLSYDDTFPFFVDQGGTVAAVLRFSEHFDLKFSGDGNWSRYSVTVTGEEVSRTDRTMLGSAELGFYLGGLSGTRIGLRYEHATRKSPLSRRNYARNRFYTEFRLSF